MKIKPLMLGVIVFAAIAFVSKQYFFSENSGIYKLVVDDISISKEGSNEGLERKSASTENDTEWEHYGGDLRGQKYSSLNQINSNNVKKLKKVWETTTGALDKYSSTPRFQAKVMAFEATPILVDGTLFVCNPFDVVVALNPKTGKRRWFFDPEVNGKVAYDHVCRGVATWKNKMNLQTDIQNEMCQRRIYVGTTDARLIALDSKTGKLCSDFGNAGTVDLTKDMGDIHPGEYYMTSPPTVVNDLVVTGALVADNWRVDAPSGVIRAFSAKTGELVWAWDGTPPNYARPVNQSGRWTRGTPNSWSIFTADPANDLIFIPTGNPAVDLYGGARRNLDYYGSSVVALKASTGEYVWHFQTVHHDLWDYDVPSQPTLFNYKNGNEIIPAIAQSTKVGHLFFLDRRTGKPLPAFPVEERSVPQSTVDGEQTSLTQPFPTKPEPFYPYDLNDPLKIKSALKNKALCGGIFDKGYRFDGVFTPPSFDGSITFPGALGGTDWGGVSVDEAQQILVLNQSHLPIVNQLVAKTTEQTAFPEIGGDSVGDFNLTGVRYYAHRSTLTNSFGLPCIPYNAGELIAFDIAAGKVLWRRPLGQNNWPVMGSSINMGGSLVTGGNLVFIGATLDATLVGLVGHFRAFNLKTGALLLDLSIPTQASATPMTYMFEGKQYVVVYVGGHGLMKAKANERIIAFALED